MNRIKWIDMARGYGIILVIIGHLYFLNLSSWIYSFHMPLFFFLSGYLFNNKYTFKTFLYKKFNGLIKPYLFLSLLVILYREIENIILGKKLDIGEQIIKFVLQRRETALWFLTCLFFINLLMFFISKTNNMLTMTILVILVTLIGLLYEKYVGLALFWNLDIACTALLFFYGGYIIKRKKYFDKVMELPQIKKIIIFIVFGEANFAGAVLNNNVSGGGLEMIGGQYGFWPLTYLAAFAGITAVIIFSMLFANKIICYFGKNTLVYFGLHQTIMIPVLDIIYTRINIFQHTDSSIAENGLHMVISLIIIFVVLTLVNEIIMKTKLKRLLNQ